MHARYYSGNLGRFLSIDPEVRRGSTNRPQRWNRYSYVQNNPMKYLDPNGEIISLAGLNDTETEQLLGELNDFTGNEYDVNDANELVLAATGENSSGTATEFFNELIGSETTYNVVSTEGTNQGLFDSNTVKLNFDSFQGADYGRVNPSAYNLGSVFVHELVHASRPLYDTLDGTREGTFRLATDWTGPVVDFVNQIRAERGFPRRAAYAAVDAGFFGRKMKLPFDRVNPKRPDRIYYVVRKKFD